MYTSPAGSDNMAVLPGLNSSLEALWNLAVLSDDENLNSHTNLQKINKRTALSTWPAKSFDPIHPHLSI